MPREPYALEIVSTPLIGWPEVNIWCDETIIRTATMPLNAANELVVLLNQVYQNGYLEGQANA